IIVLEETSCPNNRTKKAIFLQRVYSKIADRVIGVAPSVVSFLVKKVGLPKDKVLLINNGASPPEQVQDQKLKELNEKLGLRPHDLVVGSIGRLYNDVKRFTDILEAIRLLNNLSIKFLLVGSGRDQQLIKDFAVQAGLQNQFIET